MPRFRRFFLALLAVFAFLPRPSFAALIPRYDLESLCYLSTDVVEASLDGYKTNPAAVSGMATVTASLIGRYHAGDEVAISGLDLYTPARPGQRCLLFIARRQFTFDAQPPKTIGQRVVDMLFIDKYNRVQRYFQTSNPGGLLAEDYPLPGSNAFVLNAYVLDKKCPTLAAERSAIAAEWAKVDRIRPLLSHLPLPKDVPALQALVRERRQPSIPRQQNIVCKIAEERLAELHIPAQ